MRSAAHDDRALPELRRTIDRVVAMLDGGPGRS